jgi:CheY-like chemotaxis protein
LASAPNTFGASKVICRWRVRSSKPSARHPDECRSSLSSKTTPTTDFYSKPFSATASIWTLASFARARPDLVLLDISLPDMDGTEILQRIRADATLSSLPVIALTAHAMTGDREKYLAAGFDDYITKPIVDETQLFNSIERLLKKR